MDGHVPMQVLFPEALPISVKEKGKFKLTMSCVLDPNPDCKIVHYYELIIVPIVKMLVLNALVSLC